MSSTLTKRTEKGREKIRGASHDSLSRPCLSPLGPHRIEKYSHRTVTGILFGPGTNADKRKGGLNPTNSLSLALWLSCRGCEFTLISFALSNLDPSPHLPICVLSGLPPCSPYGRRGEWRAHSACMQSKSQYQLKHPPLVPEYPRTPLRMNNPRFTTSPETITEKHRQLGAAIRVRRPRQTTDSNAPFDLRKGFQSSIERPLGN